MNRNLKILGMAILTLAVVAMTASVSGASAQTRPTGAAATVTPAPTPDGGRPAPSFDVRAMVVNATLRLATSPAGLVQALPDGTKVQVVTSSGVCIEIALPANAAQTIAATKELRLPPLDVPNKDTAASKSASAVDCPAPGDRFTIALALPNGSTIPLVTTVWSAGTSVVDFTIPAPQPQSEGQQPSSSVSGLPPTGSGESGSRGLPHLALGLGVVAALFILGTWVVGRSKPPAR